MTASPPPTAPVTQPFNQFELLWDRYRSLILTIMVAVVGAIGVNYAIKYMAQKKTDSSWSGFIATVGDEDAYNDFMKQDSSLAENLSSVSLASLESSLASADAAQKPFLLLAIARRAMQEKAWEHAEKALQDLEAGYPKHTLVVSSPHPVQTQDVVKQEPDKPNTPPAQRKKTEWKPPAAGSTVQLMRAQIAAARAFVTPSQFAPVAPPADAPKVKVEFGDYGEITIALMPQAPLHSAAFLKLAESQFWVGLAVDQIRRPGKANKRPRELHFGFESTKDEDDRTKWLTTEASKNVVEFEETGLSHFPGAVAAREEADNKSCADRIWIAVDDAPASDPSRVVFGFVIEGLENLKRLCEASMSAEDEERGEGRPSDNIRVTKVTVVK